MKTEQLKSANGVDWSQVDAPFAQSAHLVMVFGETALVANPKCYQSLKKLFPKAHVVGCSSGGHALGTRLSEGDVVATAVRFDSSSLRVAAFTLAASIDFDALAHEIVDALRGDDLRHIFLLSDGLATNGSKLAEALTRVAAGEVGITGGLAGDGTRFNETWVMADGPAARGQLVAIGFYGQGLQVGTGCVAGWDEFGAERVITKSAGNVVYEIDNKPALALYKEYLGPFADELPGSAFRFPLNIRATQNDKPVIRTVLGINEADQSLTFAGDMPQGYFGRLMKTNLDGLIDSAGLAATAANADQANAATQLCLVVSCVGRRVVLQQLTEEELDIIQDKLGEHASLVGFYSYGELAPQDAAGGPCELHNQTISLTTLSELPA
ncbi:MAG TPA: FIST N-terminal domain-containing protein [Burkholderiaceae bacterium]|nr:FIST N-terminal domain-containing protein [Burkholderiaceae bacterium]